MKWIDVSSWSQSDTDRSQPKSWEAEVPHLRVSVSRHIHCAPTDWMVRVLQTEKVLKGNKTADEAKAFAESLLRSMLADVARALGDKP